MTEEEFSVIWENTPLVRVSCTEVAFQGLDFSLPDYTSNMVSFDANYLEHFRSFGDTQLFDGDTYEELLRSGAPQAFDGETAQKLVGTGSEAQPFPIEVYENLAGQSGEAVPFPMEIYGTLSDKTAKRCSSLWEFTGTWRRTMAKQWHSWRSLPKPLPAGRNRLSAWASTAREMG